MARTSTAASRASQRASRMKARYGITQAQYDAILAHQGGACGVCQGKRRYPLHVDHDHKTGRVRGLLCKSCNRRLLPAGHDDPVLFDRAISYLMDPPADAVLRVA